MLERLVVKHVQCRKLKLFFLLIFHAILCDTNYYITNIPWKMHYFKKSLKSIHTHIASFSLKQSSEMELMTQI